MSPMFIMALVFFALIMMLLLLYFFLGRSMKRTIYSFDNALLIGGILFVSVLEITMLVEYALSGGPEGQASFSKVADQIMTFPGRFANYALVLMILICAVLAVSNISLMKHEGKCFSNMLSLVLAVFYIGGTIIVSVIDQLLYRYLIIPMGWEEVGIVKTLYVYLPIFLLFMMSYFECVFFGVVFMAWLAVKHVPAYDKDYIIILGCSIDKRGGLLPLLKGRTNKAIRFAWDQEVAAGKPLKFIPSGGKGSDEIISEGSAMELYMITHGAEPDEVFPEKESANTYENFLFSKRVIDELERQKAKESGVAESCKVAFATTNYHVYRSGILARKAGFKDIEGIASDTKWYFWPNGFIREFFAVLVMTAKVHLIVAAIIAVICLLMHYVVIG